MFLCNYSDRSGFKDAPASAPSSLIAVLTLYLTYFQESTYAGRNAKNHAFCSGRNRKPPPFTFPALIMAQLHGNRRHIYAIFTFRPSLLRDCGPVKTFGVWFKQQIPTFRRAFREAWGPLPAPLLGEMKLAPLQ
jgi:hypothetical protein